MQAANKPALKGTIGQQRTRPRPTHLAGHAQHNLGNRSCVGPRAYIQAVLVANSDKTCNDPCDRTPFAGGDKI